MSRPPENVPDEQPELLAGMARATVRAQKGPAKKAVVITEVNPVARVLVDLPLAHLDRPFDYAVPQTMADTAVPGARVKVRFAGQDVDAFILERCPVSEHAGRLQPLRRVVSPEPVLARQIAELTGQVAQRYAGTRADVLRLAVPPRHATTEKESSVPAPGSITGSGLTTGISRSTGPGPSAGPGPQGWTELRHGAEFLGALAAGKAPRAVWAPPPGAQWPHLLAHATAASLSSGRGALICVPDGKDVARVSAALDEVLGPDQHVSLTADSGPAARYRDFLRVSRGAVRVVVGTRAAAYAPVHDLGLVAIWDDGDDLHAEPRAPYPHTREILLTRAELEGTAALIGGHARTVEAHYLVTTGWAVELSAGREVVRRALRVNVAGSSDHDLERDAHARTSRIPRQVFEGIRAALETGPVLVQTPRAGYAATLACERCRTPARCTACQGPLRQPRAESVPECGWCGTAAGDFRCVECGHRGLRAPVRGDARTAEELGRMFPRTLIRTSSGDRVLDTVGATPAIVVATPGAEPVAAQGYSAVVLLDTWLALARVDLRTPEEAVRRWMNAAALTRRGGNVLVVGDPAHPTIQALVRWDPAGFAERELEERRSAHLPPASRLATLTGPTGAVDDAVTVLTLPDGAELLGPLALEDTDLVRAVIRAPRRAANALSESLLELQRVRSSRKLDPVRVQVDPYAL